MCWKSSVQSRKNQPRIKSSKRPQAPVLTCARKMIITRGGGASMPKSVSSNPHIPTSRSSFMFNQPSRRRTGMFPLKYWAFKILLFASRTVQYTIWLISNFGSSHAPHAEQARRVLTEITIKFWVREPRVDWVTNWVKKSHCTSPVDKWSIGSDGLKLLHGHELVQAGGRFLNVHYLLVWDVPLYEHVCTMFIMNTKLQIIKFMMDHKILYVE